MANNQMSQEEIDALLNGGGAHTATEEPEKTKLNQEVIDIIGEVGNISMSQAATTLSQLLNRTVKITTPRVSGVSVQEIVEACEVPKVVTTIDFKSGLDGSNILMIDMKDANIIADLMMGNDGKEVAEKEFTELELSAVAEAMNQMIGSASTAMATMLKKPIDISPPVVEQWDTPDDATLEDKTDGNMICKTAFHLTVEGLLDSEIMQLLPLSTAEEITEIMLGDEAEVLSGRELASEKTSSKSDPDLTQATPEQEVTVQKPTFQQLNDEGQKEAPRNLDLIMDVPLDFSVVLGQSRKTIKDILSLGTGSVVELEKMTDEPLEIYVNGQLIAEGEVVVINESFGVRITNILSKEERIKHLN